MRRKYSFHPACLLLASLSVWVGPGCEKKFPEVVDQSRPKVTKTESTGNLGRAMDYLHHLDQYTPQMVHDLILLNLNQWIERQKPDPDWIADPLFARLPQRFQASIGNVPLEEMKFQPFDILYLRESVWMHDISTSVARRQRPVYDLEAWTETVTEQRGRDVSDQLYLAAQLFDWTIRHIQLDAERTSAGDTPTSKDPLAGFTPLPGGKYYAWESMLFNHGDAWERARIFLLLARQQRIPVVILGIEDAGDDFPRPWCTAAWIGGELYLFDTQLGLPIPGPNDSGIATLRAVQDDPSLLRQLDLGNERSYPVRKRHLDRITAFMDATPAALSQRMTVLESNLIGSNYVALTFAPTALWQEIREHPGLIRQSLSVAPYEVYAFRNRMVQAQAAGQPLPSIAIEIAIEHRPFDDLTPLLQGTMLAYRGRFENGRDDFGAKHLLGQSRKPNADISALMDSEEAQRALQIYPRLYVQVPDPETGQLTVRKVPNYEGLVRATQDLLIQMKEHASYLIGLIESDERRYRQARNWLVNRTLEAYPDGMWTSGARYNLARIYEEQAATDEDPSLRQKAREIYESMRDEPGGHGAAIRARRLERITAEP